MVLADHEVPVAYSMVTAAAQLPESPAHPMQVFTCYWAAFNNIYVAVAEKAGRRTQLKTNADGSIRTRVVGPVNVPEVTPVTEREQMDLAFHRFSEELKHTLVEHPSTRFFVHRTPHWRGLPIETDPNGQRLNGVLNVGHTVDSEHPVWTPIDSEMFEKYCRGARDAVTRDVLARQVLNVLYTVRNNTFHGGKRADDANDQEVLEKALPLLAMIVQSFVRVRNF